MSERPTSRGERKKAMEAQTKSVKKKKVKKTNWIKRVILLLVTAGVVLFAAGAGLFAYYASSAPELDEELLRDPITPTFLAADGKTEIPVITSENREYVDYENIPTILEDAILATEDNRFYEHSGIDVIRLGGAVIANITGGFGSQGASTITQQVIKNSFLSNDKTLKRKAQEAYLAFQLEQEFEKEEIFEMYFNKILMSGNIYGFGTASEYFFGKPVNELQLHEAALLAGMPQSPNGYNPFKNPERAEERRNIVLSLMEQHGRITTEEKEAAQAIPIADSLLAEAQRPKEPTGEYRAFMELVQDELETLDGDFSLDEGVTVHTTLEPSVQQAVNRTLSSDIFFNDEVLSALTVVDTQTGAIRAIGPGREYSGDVRKNYATLKERVIGSTIKPLVDYGPAIEYLDWSTGKTLVDEEMTYGNSDQVVRNFDGEYLGAMTMREALYRSRNVPAVKTLQEVGAENASEFTKKLGLDFGQLYESAAIGTPEKPISTVEMAGAFAAFGNEGVFTEPHTITKVVLRDGTTEYNVAPESVPAMQDSTAYMITDMLRDVLDPDLQGASGTAAAVPGVDIAGKTGTSNYTEKEFEEYDLPEDYAPDVWFAGYSPNYSISVWSGYPTRANGIDTGLREQRTLSQRVFQDVMSQISQNVENTTFEKPESVVELEIEEGTDPLRLASAYTPYYLRSTELFVRGTEPTTVSQQFRPAKPSTPVGLTADYDPDSESVILDWSYNGDDDVQFVVSVGGSTLVTTERSSFSYDNIEAGTTYTFSVTAVSDGGQSDPASVTVQIEAPEEEEPAEEPVEEPVEEEPVPEPEEPEEPADSGSDGDNGGDGSGEGSDDGSDDGSDEGSDDDSGNGSGNDSGTGNGNTNSGNGNGSNGNNNGNNNSDGSNSEDQNQSTENETE